MKPENAAFNFGSFFQKLVIVGLGLLLPLQLGLLWFSTFKEPKRLPDFVAAFVSNQLSKEGIQLQARSLWLQPDLDIAADDVSLAFEGISGEMITAKHLEVGISLWGLLSGHTTPHRLSIQGGQVWCPAALSQFGQKNLLVEAIDGDFHREGRWIITPGFILRSGPTMATIEGEVPVSILDFKNSNPADLVTLRSELSSALKGLEQFIQVTKQAGGASLHLHAEGLADDGSMITLSGQLGNQNGDTDLGLLQAHELIFLGEIKINRYSDCERWSLTGMGNNLRYKNLQLDNLALELTGTDEWMPTHGRIIGSNARLPELPDLQLLVELASHQSGDQTEQLQVSYKIHSPASFIEGQIDQIPKGWNKNQGLGELECRITHAQLDTSELLKFPTVESALHEAKIKAAGVMGVQDARLYFNNELKRITGWVSFSGIETHGLSAKQISPQQNLPLLAFVDYNRDRQSYALLVRELQLATVRGEVDWALTPAASYNLRLYGDLSPRALDQVLGPWWTDLEAKLQVHRGLNATIDVSGQLHPPQAKVAGMVHLDAFDFQKAPFQSADIYLRTDQSGVRIELKNLTGRSDDNAGVLEGTATWNNQKPAGESGPYVELKGNLQPWIIAACANASLGEKLKNLQLPLSRNLLIKARPGAHGLEVEAELSCLAEFSIYGIPSQNLLCKIQNGGGATTIRTTLNIADGLGSLSIMGEPDHPAKISFALKDCDSNLIARGLGYGKIPASKKNAPKEATRFNFSLDGTIDLQAPEQIRCLGGFEIANPEIKKIRILGGLSTVLEAIGIKSTTYELTQLTGQFGCINGRAYFPDILISGPQSQLSLKGEVDLAAGTVDFAGLFNIPQKENAIIPNPFNLNRTIADNTQISIKGPLSDLKTSATPSFFFLHKLFNRIGLGKIPSELTE